MCGPSSEEKSVMGMQLSFANTLMANYNIAFGQQQSILSALRSVYQPIFNAGPNQQGFSDAERTTLNAEAKEDMAQNYGFAKKAVSESIAARGGGDAFLPSGGDEQLREEMASSAAGELSKEQQDIVMEDYATGRQQWEEAGRMLSGEAAMENPTGAASVADTESANASKTANDITQAENSWMAPVAGILGGVAASPGWK